VTPLYPQKLALTSPTGGGRSVGIVRSRTKATDFSLVSFIFLTCWKWVSQFQTLITLPVPWRLLCIFNPSTDISHCTCVCMCGVLRRPLVRFTKLWAQLTNISRRLKRYILDFNSLPIRRYTHTSRSIDGQNSVTLMIKTAYIYEHLCHFTNVHNLKT
jgi:hypothetical protein